METNEKYKTNKKVAIRFLKELGLLDAWKEYLKSDFKPFSYDGEQNLNNWYENEEYVDVIFGKTNFTLFLNYKKNYHSKSITYLFRSYILSMGIKLPILLEDSIPIAQYKHIVNGNK